MRSTNRSKWSFCHHGEGSRLPWRRDSGQTLIIAMIILGLLLILGFVFLGIVDRNIRGTATAQTRSQANDLAEGGIQEAHYQLVNSPLGADWRGQPTTLSTVNGSPNLTLDPDAYYLRPGSFLPWKPGSTQEDLGGPDGLGPFIRINFNGGRALIRVRLASSDVNYFNASPTGPLRNPGQVHDYLQIESIGRIGVVNPGDPTTLSTGSGVQFQGFTTSAQLQAALSAMQTFDARFANSRHLLAFDTIGIIDFARFITNKFNVSRPADIGIPSNSGLGLPGLGVTFSPTGTGNDPDVGSYPTLYYQAGSVGTIASTATPNPAPPLGGSLMSNADLTFHGNLSFYLNSFLGDKILVNGNIAADSNAQLSISNLSYDPNLPASGDPNAQKWLIYASPTWVPYNFATPQVPVALTPNQFTSRSSAFDTYAGTIIDGAGGTDAEGYSRGVGRLVPPSMLQVDPSTHESRYLELSRDLGPLNANGAKSSEYGHGQGVYVQNPVDIQQPTDETGRANAGGSESLLNDYQNPNNGDKTSGWQGEFYIPFGAYVQLQKDGFVITLDQNQTWKNPDGSDSGQNSLRFRIGMNDVQDPSTGLWTRQQYIVDGLETPGTINNDPSKGQGSPDFTKGQPFNGVLYFEGNARVRGQIPTDVQMTLVSRATIYIEGSITKGLRGNDVTDNYNNADPLASTFGAAYGNMIQRPSKSTLMLMAKDNVVVNTTSFTGPSVGQAVNPVSDTQNETGYDPIRIAAAGGTNSSLALSAEMPLDPYNDYAGYNPMNPSTWQPYALGYSDSLAASSNPTPVLASLLTTHTMDNGTGAASFISMFVNYGAYGSPDQHEANYSFPGSPSSAEAANQGPDGQLGYFSGFDNTASDYLYNSTDPRYFSSLSAPPNAPAPYTGLYSQYMYGLGRDSWQRYDQFESREFHLVYPTYPGTAGATTYANGQISVTPAGATVDPYIQYVLFSDATNQFLISPNSISGVPANDYLLARAQVVPNNVTIEASIFAEEGCFYVIPGPWFNPNPNDTRDAYNSNVAAFVAGGSTNTVAMKQASQQRLESYGTGPEVPFYGEPVDVKVNVTGSVSENMPPPESAQVASMQKWGWIPVTLGALQNPSTGAQVGIPTTHVPAGTNAATAGVVPNVIIQYDPVLATGRIDGFSGTNDPAGIVRTDLYGRPLAPMPRLPVSPVPTYFGEIQ